MAYKISDDCIGCGVCKDNCPVDAISEGAPYVIDADTCIDCGACAGNCPIGAPAQE
ncbi:MAG: 4Fe-4S binding protein [Clostridiales bacterium]|nr:4Fe-4S binding protein [Candidatus Crickella caballi]